jgi:tetratricopeptide (TPR) repeat protein
MSRRATILTLCVLVGLAGACAKQEQATTPAEEAFGALRTAWSEAETSEAKTQLAEDYLAQFPDTEHSGSMAGAIVYYRGNDMEDPEGAYEIVSAALEQIEDPEQRFGVSMELLGLSDSVDVPLDIAVVAIDLGAVRPLTYSEDISVVETATDLEEWTVADEHALGALELASPEIYRADYPDREFTDEEVASRVGRRKALALAYDGWALYNLGDTELAFERFEAADEAKSLTYLGVPNTPLYEFWGRAALGEGRYDRAIELLGMETLFGEDGSGAEPYLREAYAAKNGDDDGFDEFLWATRSELATSVDDFELLDYDGNPVTLSDVGDDKVMLLAFWFPT